MSEAPPGEGAPGEEPAEGPSEDASAEESQTGFSVGVVWNVGSQVVLAVCGLLMQFLIARCYGPEILGTFNLAFSVYIFASQLAVFGLYFSVLKFVSQHAADVEQRSAILSSALALSILTATLTCLGGYALAPGLSWAWGSEELLTSWLWLLPGLWAYSVNKVLMAALNGVRHMRAFALAQASRYLLVVIGLVVCVGTGVKGPYVTAAVSAAELLLCVSLALYLTRSFRPVGPSRWGEWTATHFRFGRRSFLSGSVAELNTRVDVLMLGLFLDEARVGIYSLASMVAEGIAMLGYAVRENVNPLLPAICEAEDWDELRRLAGRVVLRTYVGLALAGLVAIAGFPVVVWIAGEGFSESWLVFSILVGGLVLSGGFLPFNMFLVQAGMPRAHTLLKVLVLASNVVLNLILIPPFGVWGAALATGASFLLAVVYLQLFAKRLCGTWIPWRAGAGR